MGLGTRSAIPHPRRSQIAPMESRTAIPVYGTITFDATIPRKIPKKPFGMNHLDLGLAAIHP